MRLLVTGGAGYIGSHFIDLALEHGYSDIVVVDDLSTGIRARVPSSIPLHQIDLAGEASVTELTKILREHQTDAVVHFAAKKVVSESVELPEEYFRVNIGATLNLLTAMRIAGVKRMIFSSSAAVYGEPDEHTVFESDKCAPINPYGESKFISELSLANATRAWGLDAVSLRYFNVAGAKNSVLADTTTTNLLPAIRDAITNDRPVAIFGNDYDTEDGTCIRDYIHIVDLVEAHLVALTGLDRDADPETRTYNVGTGAGSSVLEIVNGFLRLPNIDVRYEYHERRPGDPAALMAHVGKIYSELGWRSRFTTNDIVESVVQHAPVADESAVS